MPQFMTLARLFTLTVLGAALAASLALPDSAHAAASACEDRAALQKRLDAFDARWNASDAWGLTVQFSPEASLGAGGGGSRAAIYRHFVERLAAGARPRSTQLLRAAPQGDGTCRLDVIVRTSKATESGEFVLGRGGQGAGFIALR